MISKEKLSILTDRIRDDFGYEVRLCGEIEWLFHHQGAVPDTLFEALLKQAKQEAVPLESIGREKTDNPLIQQYEFRFKSSDPLGAVAALEWLDETLEELTERFRIPAHRCAVEEVITSGLHWHLHLLDKEDNYQFFKSENEMSAPLGHTLAGLLFTMPTLMPYFMPSEASYQRITSGVDHVPTKICWGGNNRSVALRMPESVIPLRHIEHRVCGADADVTQSAWAILVGIHYGLTHQPPLPPQCFGDANRPESDFPLLPRSAEEVPEVEWLRDYLG